MTIERILLFAALACGLALAAASPAFAASCRAGDPHFNCVWHTAKAAHFPGHLPCTKTEGSTVCFQRKGDKVWVKDTLGDSFSAISKAQFPRFGIEYYCRNKLGTGRWGVCNERLQNGPTFYFWAARYDGPTKRFLGPWSAGASAQA
jgi:hypothetical protein